MSSREGYRQSGDFDESGEFGENDEISLKIERMSSREGYQQSGDFSKSSEFGENDKVDDISPKIKKRAKFTGFVEIAALSVLISQAHSL